MYDIAVSATAEDKAAARKNQTDTRNYVAAQKVVRTLLAMLFSHISQVSFRLVIRGDVKICHSLPLLSASGCCGAAAFCRQLK